MIYRTQRVGAPGVTRAVLSALFAVLALAAARTALSETSDDGADGGEQDQQIDEVVVHGHPLGGAVSQSTDVLDGEELDRVARESIGGTLAQTPGVHSASFGPAVGHPVIHGLTGTRVLVLENHTSSMDVSSSGADHSIAVEPFLADRIEVIKGSGTLLYGSGAMGGAVDVHTRRIPTEVPEDGLSGRVLIRGDTGSDARYAGFRLDGGGGGWAWHLDGYSGENSDLSVPGYAALDPHHDEEEEEHHDEEEEDEHHDEEEHEEPVEGVLENSFGDRSGGAFGAAYLGERSHFGVSVAVRDWTYGIVGEHAHGEEEHHEDEHADEHEEEEADHEDEHDEHGEESPVIVLEQTKFMSEFGLRDPFPGFTSLEGNFVVSDYEHSEIEGEGEVASYFGNEAWQLRGVMEAEPRGTWESAVGIQFGGSDFVFGSGGEYEPVESSHWAIFGVAHADLDEFILETGARLESVEHTDHDGQSLDFLATSLSAGVVVPVEQWELTARLDRSMRAPEGEELFAAGAHLAIGGFQMGSADLDEEQSLNLSVGAVYRSEGFVLKLTGYRYGFDNFIYQRETDDHDDDHDDHDDHEDEEGHHDDEDHHDELPVFQWSQTEATLLGFDVEARFELLTEAQASADLVLGYDWVTTDVDDPHETHLPRIPPQRLAIAAEATWKDLWGRIAYTHHADQDEVTSHETPTDGYGNLDIEGEYATRLGEADLVFFVAGRNLGDEEQRQHSSFVKDEAPLAGRRVEAGVRIRF
ncbi:MAG: TonB-dependent receptor [Gammaproteobacteria bacterium]|nr:TonB-dependent receptor [Gammaproteobacteria bacterium]